ncbi:MAG: DUF4265 domain-containing protein [Actinomycetota bacterium]
MAAYLEHPARPTRPAGDEYLVFPDALNENATVWFAFEPDRWEGVLAVRITPDRARLVGVPLWTYGVNLGDVVEIVASAEGAPVAVRVVERSSNRTFRVVFQGTPPQEPDERWRDLVVDLEANGCWFDVLRPDYLAISASVDQADAVEEYLHSRSEEGDFIYERSS